MIDSIILVNSLFLVIYIFIVFLIVFNSGPYQIPLAYINFCLMWSLVSTYSNDLGDYNFELTLHTFPTLATSYLSLLYIIFNLGIFSAYRFSLIFNNSLNRIRVFRLPSFKITNNLFIIFIFLILSIEFFSVAGNFSALLSGNLSRATTFETGSFIIKFLLSYPFIAPIIIAYIATLETKKYKHISAVLIIFYIMILIGSGHKFSSLIDVLFYYFASRFWSSSNSFKGLDLRNFFKKILNFRILVFPTLIFCYIYYTYAQIAGGYSDILFELLYDRIFLFQGQLFWTSFVDYIGNGALESGHLAIEIQKIIDPYSVNNSEVGMQYVMIQALGNPAYEIIDKGYLYTMSFPGILLYMMSYPYICLTMFIFGAFYMIIIIIWRLGAVKKSMFTQLLALSILGPFITLLFTGNFYVFFTLLLFIKFLILSGMLIAGIRK